MLAAFFYAAFCWAIWPLPFPRFVAALLLPAAFMAALGGEA